MLFIRLITIVLCICIVCIGSQIKTTSTTFCSDTIAIIESKLLNDTSWIEYIHEVYGSEDLYDTTNQSSSSKIVDRMMALLYLMLRPDTFIPCHTPLSTICFKSAIITGRTSSGRSLSAASTEIWKAKSLSIQLDLKSR